MPDDADRSLRLSGLPGAADEPFAGGARFVAYCNGAPTRAWVRREAINRAWTAHNRAASREEDPYATALVLAQRLGVALEDLGRLTVALATLHSGDDAFGALRSATIDDMTTTFARVAADPKQLRAALRLPGPDSTDDLDGDEREALLTLADAVAARWLEQWQRAASGWQLLNKIAKAMRHGSPLPTRELIVEPPGGGALGRGLENRFDRWVLVVETTADQEARTHETKYAAADVSDETLSRARQGGLDAIALTKSLAEAHVHRVATQSRWALPSDALRCVPRDVARVLKAHARG